MESTQVNGSRHYSPERSFAKELDLKDPLKSLRADFLIPTKRMLAATTLSQTEGLEEDEPAIYFCGNQIGLQPQRAQQLIQDYLRTWATQGMYGLPKKMGDSMLPNWGQMDQVAAQMMAPIVGALPHEVSVMNNLTTNLHVLMASFYEPSGDRTKVIIERDTFSSDYYAVESQIQWHGLDVKQNMVLIDPESEQTGALSVSNILEVIDQHASSAALILLSGVQYLTGQVLDMEKISAYAHSKGIVVGWDLAHATGNVELHLHDWDVDFAVWCNYKYMNAGPGVIGSIFVHEKHGHVDPSKGTNGYRRRLAGWWGNDMSSRFAMVNSFAPSVGAAGYQLSNASILDSVALIASLQVFERTNMSSIRQKSVLLTGYLDYLLRDMESSAFEIMTSPHSAERGAQVSLRFQSKEVLDQVMMKLRAKGIVAAQKNDVMRLAPVALYNTFEEVWVVVDELRNALL